MSLYNVYLCGRLVIFHSRYFIRVSQEEHAQSNSVEIDNTSANIPHRTTYSLPAANNSQPLDTTNNNYADSVFLGKAILQNSILENITAKLLIVFFRTRTGTIAGAVEQPRWIF